MKVKETKIKQSEKLKAICDENKVDFDSINELIESAKTKKLLKRNNYHQQKINDIIEKSIR